MIFNPSQYGNVAKSTKEIFTIPTQGGTITYNGAVQSPSWNNYNTGYMTISGQTSATDAGTYTVTFSLNDPENSYWADYTTDDKVVNWTIQPGIITKIPVGLGSTYSGETMNALIDYENDSMFTISGDTSAINAGEYVVIVTPTSNYQWSDGTRTGKEVTWYIYKADVYLDISIYDITLTKNNPQEVITATYVGDGELSCVFAQGENNIISTNIVGNKIYCNSTGIDGWAIYSVLVSETQNYNSGRYDLYVTASGFSGGSTEGKQPNSISVTPESITLEGYMDSSTFNVERLGDGEITVFGYSSDLIDVAVYGTTITVTAMEERDFATTELYINVAETDEYESATVTATVYITASENPSPPVTPWYLNLSTKNIILTGYGNQKSVEVFYPGDGVLSVDIPSGYSSNVGAQIWQEDKLIYFTQHLNIQSTFTVTINVGPDSNYSGGSINLTVMTTYS